MKKIFLLVTLIALFININSVFADQSSHYVCKQPVEITKENIYNTQHIEVDMIW